MPEPTDTFAAVGRSIEEMTTALRQQNAMQETLVRLAAAPMFEDMHETLDRKQLSLAQTLDAIHSENLSFARFGDGEFMLLMKTEFNIKFQKNSPALQAALSESLNYAAENEDKVLIGYPHIFHNQHWTGIFSDVWPLMKSHAVKFDRLGDSHVSRPLAFAAYGEEAGGMWQRIWSGSNVVIVAGRGSRFDLVPELFDGFKNVNVVSSLPAHAFEDLPRVINEVERHRPDKVLIALGPAGTILATELAKRGIQALDIGHLSASYTNVMTGGQFPENTPHVRA